jgi:psiF repeat
MKTLSALAVAAILGCGAAGATDPPAAPSATPIKHPTLKSCNREAAVRKLTGKQRAEFVKNCQAGRTSS